MVGYIKIANNLKREFKRKHRLENKQHRLKIAYDKVSQDINESDEVIDSLVEHLSTDNRYHN